MPKDHCEEGLDSRCRDENGRIRQKRADTLVDTLRREYGSDFASGFRSDAKLGTVRNETGKSLSELVHGNKRKS